MVPQFDYVPFEPRKLNLVSFWFGFATRFCPTLILSIALSLGIKVVAQRRFIIIRH